MADNSEIFKGVIILKWFKYDKVISTLICNVTI